MRTTTSARGLVQRQKYQPIAQQLAQHGSELVSAGTRAVTRAASAPGSSPLYAQQTAAETIPPDHHASEGLQETASTADFLSEADIPSASFQEAHSESPSAPMSSGAIAFPDDMSELHSLPGASDGPQPSTKQGSSPVPHSGNATMHQLNPLPAVSSQPAAPLDPLSASSARPQGGAPTSPRPAGATAAALPQSTQENKEDFQFTERAVPSTTIGRAFGFGTMAAGMAFGLARNWAGQALGGGGSGEGGSGTLLDTAGAEKLAAGLARMRGAALKLGQMLSLQDEASLPPAVSEALARVRHQADIMPQKQLVAVMQDQLGAEWRSLFGDWSERPIAAASIGQVHKATVQGQQVAVKVQYPGVADSIDSDLNNLERLLLFSGLLPKGLYLENIIKTARVELKRECDYRYEAESQERFRVLLADDPDLVVPEVIHSASSERVLTSQWLDGIPLDQVKSQPQEVRNAVGRLLLRLTLLELFEFRFSQTDPNPSNFFFLPQADGRAKLGLLDFGASREYSKSFIDEYLRLVWAASNNDRDGLLDSSLKLGFLTGMESRVMVDAHVEAGMVVGEPFRNYEAYNFAGSDITSRVGEHAAVFADHRLTPPPEEVYSLHRKLAGCFLLCIRIGAQIPCRQLLEEFWNTHDWDAPHVAAETVVTSER